MRIFRPLRRPEQEVFDKFLKEYTNLIGYAAVTLLFFNEASFSSIFGMLCSIIALAGVFLTYSEFWLFRNGITREIKKRRPRTHLH